MYFTLYIMYGDRSIGPHYEPVLSYDLFYANKIVDQFKKSVQPVLSIREYNKSDKKNEFDEKLELANNHFKLQKDNLDILCGGEIIVNWQEIESQNYGEKNVYVKQCQIAPNQMTKSTFNARVKTYCFSHQWTIESFRLLCNDNAVKGQPRIQSNKFSPMADNDIQFYLVLYPKGSDRDSQNYISVYLCVDDSTENSCEFSA